MTLGPEECDSLILRRILQSIFHAQIYRALHLERFIVLQTIIAL